MGFLATEDKHVMYQIYIFIFIKCLLYVEMKVYGYSIPVEIEIVYMLDTITILFFYKQHP